jgi:hypothetical protein
MFFCLNEGLPGGSLRACDEPRATRERSALLVQVFQEELLKAIFLNIFCGCSTRSEIFAFFAN